MKCVVICGPTGVGKSEIAIKLAEKINGVIISADSMQVYKHMNIGTAKILENEKKGIKHYLIDIVEPSISFSVADFKKYAEEAIEEILKNKKIPIIAGGTGLYIKAITDGLSTAPKGDEKIRNDLEKLDSKELYDKLLEVDYEIAQIIHPNNKKKIIRALEVFLISGKNMSWYHKNAVKNNNILFFKYGIEISRDKLYEKINFRVDKMIESGLIEEAKYLYNNYKNCETANQAIGYKELFDYFENKITLEEAVNNIKQATRNYAKRQFTWFRKDKDIKWFNLDSISSDEVIKKIINEIFGV